MTNDEKPKGTASDLAIYAQLVGWVATMGVGAVFIVIALLPLLALLVFLVWLAWMIHWFVGFGVTMLLVGLVGMFMRDEKF
ncbi:hypothetical protein OG784_12930 [Streptomyces sp. NBC_01617]|uniref:hypothetical protein n=1 Tax=Streptomyces sp. NBC_01617 TaxID=2975899 RepID=UPI00386EC59A|nr:hypothetical protein OG784_12930 [Streptomyces sp. NBC_01617]